MSAYETVVDQEGRFSFFSHQPMFNAHDQEDVGELGLVDVAAHNSCGIQCETNITEHTGFQPNYPRLDQSSRSTVEQPDAPTSDNTIESPRDAETRKPRCSTCSRRFRQQSELDDHLATRACKRRFVCPICGGLYAGTGSLREHMRRHTGERPYKCEFCGKQFAGGSGYRRHVGGHLGRRPFGCHICSKTFPARAQLVEHARCHTGEKPYLCEFCGKTFSVATSLRKHAILHSGRRPYACEQCGKTFTQPVHLRTHVQMVHERRRTYPCDLCERAFCVKSALMSHLRVHTGEKPHSCFLCGNDFTRYANMRLHVARVHKMSVQEMRRQAQAPNCLSVASNVDKVIDACLVAKPVHDNHTAAVDTGSALLHNHTMTNAATVYSGSAPLPQSDGTPLIKVESVTSNNVHNYTSSVDFGLPLLNFESVSAESVEHELVMSSSSSTSLCDKAALRVNPPCISVPKSSVYMCQTGLDLSSQATSPLVVSSPTLRIPPRDAAQRWADNNHKIDISKLPAAWNFQEDAKSTSCNQMLCTAYNSYTLGSHNCSQTGQNFDLGSQSPVVNHTSIPTVNNGALVADIVSQIPDFIERLQQSAAVNQFLSEHVRW